MVAAANSPMMNENVPASFWKFTVGEDELVPISVRRIVSNGDR